MNKEQIILKMDTLCKVFGLDPSAITLVGSGAFVMLDKLLYAEDLDLQVSEGMFNVLKRALPSIAYSKKFSVKGLTHFLKWDNFDVHFQPLIDGDSMVTNGVCHLDLHSAVLFKRTLGRPKDFAHLEQMGLLDL